MSGLVRSRWAAIGAAVAVTLGVGGVSLTQAAIPSDEGGVFFGIEPCRLVDTRPATQVGPKSTPLGPNDALRLRVIGSTGQCSDIPADATGAAMNVTAVQPTAQSFLTVYPSGSTRPNASNLNWAAGDPPTPNKIDVKLGDDGEVEIFNSAGTVHIAADLVGYYVGHDHDDRYYTEDEVDAALTALRTETVTFSGFDMEPVGELINSVGTSNGCAFMAGGRLGYLTLPIPQGAKLVAVTADIIPFDGYEIRLERRTSTGTGEVATASPPHRGQRRSRTRRPTSLLPTRSSMPASGSRSASTTRCCNSDPVSAQSP